MFITGYHLYGVHHFVAYMTEPHAVNNIMSAEFVSTLFLYCFVFCGSQ